MEREHDGFKSSEWRMTTSGFEGARPTGRAPFTVPSPDSASRYGGEPGRMRWKRRRLQRQAAMIPP